MQCLNCGKDYPDGASFCPDCGAANPGNVTRLILMGDFRIRDFRIRDFRTRHIRVRVILMEDLRHLLRTEVLRCALFLQS